MQRGNGILLSISSLPGRYGIGTLGKEAYNFIDDLKECCQSYWQILPFSPTGYGDSPYQALSLFAGNPYFIDFEALYEKGLITKEILNECSEVFEPNSDKTDYYQQYCEKPVLLKKTYDYSYNKIENEVDVFAEENSGWIKDYALYMSLKESFDMKSFREWPEEYAKRDVRAIREAELKLKERTRFHIFVQYLFYMQWQDVRNYANNSGIKIIGDMPIYMAPDGADAWANQDLLRKGLVAGCPPDYFAETGQLWGNPVYDWEALEKEGFKWWVDRVKHQASLYDYIRLDHFRGLESYYAIDAEETTACNGIWQKGPGIKLFATLKREIGDLPFIAEDLGFLTEEVFQLLKDTGFPGLKVLQFAFDSPDSIYLPQNFNKNCVVYTGTHDNDTTSGWYAGLEGEKKAFINDYIGGDINDGNIHLKMIRLAMSSTADVCIIPMQDILGLPSSARMNFPQIAEGNWQWRLNEGQFGEGEIGTLKKLTELYGRRVY
jgi:4-alpha-glucanotransferase